MKNREIFIKGFLCLLSLLSLIFLLGICIILFKEGFPLFRVVSLKDFLLGKFWYPTHEVPEFGILPLLLGSLVVTLGAIIVAFPLGVSSAIYVSQVTSSKIKEIIKPLIELLAGIPSVVYGFFGMAVFSPFIQRVFNLPVGLNAFSASIILGIMATPTVFSISEDALSSVPKKYKEASLSLGATKLETIFRVILPAAGSGIITAVILGIARAIGETMTVLMIAGGSAAIPRSIFDPVRPITATIAAEMGETVVGSLHFHSLFAIGIVLFLISLGFNILADILHQRFQEKLR